MGGRAVLTTAGQMLWQVSGTTVFGGLEFCPGSGCHISLLQEALLETAVGPCYHSAVDHCYHSAVWLRKAVHPLLSGTGALSIPFTLSSL